MRSQTNIFRVWNEYREVPAIHAAGIVSVFFSAAFLNFGWMCIAFVVYAILAVRSLYSRKIRSLQAYVQCLSLEAAVLLFGLLYEICFRVWMPVLPSLNPAVRATLWLMLAAVLLSTKFFLIARVIDASCDDGWFDHMLKNNANAILSFTLLVASLTVFLLAQFGPNAREIPGMIVQSLLPGIL